jgi:hypothetical protein
MRSFKSLLFLGSVVVYTLLAVRQDIRRMEWYIKNNNLLLIYLLMIGSLS